MTMAKIRQGILGGFSGSVGVVVGANWKGIDYMRAKATHVHDPKTEGQMDQRSKFAVTVHALQPFTDYLRIGFKEYAVKMSGFNAAFSYNIKNAISGAYPDYEVDYTKMLVARGSLLGVEGGTATGADGKITFSWSENSGWGYAKPTDVALPIIYNAAKRLCVFGTSPASRISESTEVAVPVSWVGDSVIAFMAFQSMDGAMVSDSAYLGEIVVV